MMWNDDYYHKLEEQFNTATSAQVAKSYKAAMNFVKEVRTLLQGFT